MDIPLRALVAVDLLGTVFSGAQAVSQIALSPWRTVAGVVVGAVASLFVHLGVMSATKGTPASETKVANKLHVATFLAFGILGPAEARFALLNKVGDLAKKYLGRGFSLHICNPFLNGFNLGFTGFSLALSGIGLIATSKKPITPSRET